MNDKVILYKNKDQCCGCSACYCVCPRNAIKMTEDREGFLYPKINTEICIACKMCLQVCPFKR